MDHSKLLSISPPYALAELMTGTKFYSHTSVFLATPLVGISLALPRIAQAGIMRRIWDLLVVGTCVIIDILVFSDIVKGAVRTWPGSGTPVGTYHGHGELGTLLRPCYAPYVIT